MDGLLIEPHLLERNKEEEKNIAELMESKEGVEDISKNSVIDITSSVEQKQADLDYQNSLNLKKHFHHMKKQ